MKATLACWAGLTDCLVSLPVFESQVFMTAIGHRSHTPQSQPQPNVHRAFDSPLWLFSSSVHYLVSHQRRLDWHHGPHRIHPPPALHSRQGPPRHRHTPTARQRNHAARGDSHDSDGDEHGRRRDLLRLGCSGSPVFVVCRGGELEGASPCWRLLMSESRQRGQA
jgi:hypothetical protein